jgi:hypothetical protein
MHAVVIDVTIKDRAAAESGLREQVVPRAASAPGFVAGYWLDIGEDQGHAIIVFESQESAQTWADGPPTVPDAPVAVDSVKVVPVVANA